MLNQVVAWWFLLAVVISRFHGLFGLTLALYFALQFLSSVLCPRVSKAAERRPMIAHGFNPYHYPHFLCSCWNVSNLSLMVEEFGRVGRRSSGRPIYEHEPDDSRPVGAG